MIRGGVGESGLTDAEQHDVVAVVDAVHRTVVNRPLLRAQSLQPIAERRVAKRFVGTL